MVQVCRPLSVTLTKAFLNIIVSLIQLGWPDVLVHHFIAQQKQIHEEYQVCIRSVLSKHYYVSFTDNVSVPQTLDCSVNPGFAKLVSSTDNSSNCVFIDQMFAVQEPVFRRQAMVRDEQGQPERRHECRVQQGGAGAPGEGQRPTERKLPIPM